MGDVCKKAPCKTRQEDAGGRLLGGTLSFTPVCCHGCRALVLMAPGGTYRMPRAERKWEWRRCDVPRC
ncbi:NADH dehydrogenase [ubiquinone] 1 alpha subcomplex assembly factor 8 isoform X2 [Pan troglodytes]|uniref:NADH dehydrogenase [ubiquinone] 1 alpha subcomplex assembly factor 8 isoform X2 n=1 Tax=Pan troglodytes TaxID=9598 RepID=UPI000D0A2661|nr:NADH dehydrogenase [ubiquinone] 1 alpha subcomplex assembly factor 8 isoform X2 [Pan troglodytes]